MRSLRKLSLSRNYISLMDADAFVDMPRLTSITLTGNRLINVPSLSAVPGLAVLRLDDNQIEKIQYSFVHLDGLSELTVSA